MRSLNKVFLIGALGKDADTKFTPSGMACTKFSVATNRRWKDKNSGEFKEETDWANVVVWGAENLATYLVKGTKIHIEGRLSTRSYENKEGVKVYVTEVVADGQGVILLGDGQSKSADAPVSAPRSSRRAPAPAPVDSITDDDVPF
jgi:single-strand DNA-binding protein